MLKDYEQYLLQQRQANPISPDDFSAWKSNPITKQLFQDTELAMINNRPQGTDRYCGMQAIFDHMTEWDPQVMEGKANGS